MGDKLVSVQADEALIELVAIAKDSAESLVAQPEDKDFNESVSANRDRFLNGFLKLMEHLPGPEPIDRINQAKNYRRITTTGAVIAYYNEMPHTAKLMFSALELEASFKAANGVYFIDGVASAESKAQASKLMAR